MSLRTLPPEQDVRPGRWRALRFVPLITLTVLSLVAAALGVFVSSSSAAREARGAEQASVVPLPASAETALAASCAPRVDPPEREPWSDENAVASEEVWISHASEMTEAYITGEEGWVFWGDIQAMNFSQAVGRRTLSNEEATNWHTYLADLRDSLKEEGIPFYIAVTPAKWDVYPQFLPEWAQDLRGSTPLDQIIANFPDLPIIDMREALRAASKDNPTYSRVNSHWTDYGALVGWQHIASCIATSDSRFAGIGAPAISGVTVEGGNNEYATYGVTNPSSDWTEPQYTETLRPVHIVRADGSSETVDGSVRTGLEMLPAETSTVGAQSDNTALVLRDSFGSSLSVQLQQSFVRTIQVRHNFDFGPGQTPNVDQLVQRHDPDIVILQMAERHLNFPPAASR